MANRPKESQQNKKDDTASATKLVRRIVYLNDEEYEALRKRAYETRQSMAYIMRCGIRKELDLPEIPEPSRGRPKADAKE